MVWTSEHRILVVEEYTCNGGSAISTQRAFRIQFQLGRRDSFPDIKTMLVWVSNFRAMDSALKKKTVWPTFDQNNTGKCGACEGPRNHVERGLVSTRRSYSSHFTAFTRHFKGVVSWTSSLFARRHLLAPKVTRSITL